MRHWQLKHPWSRQPAGPLVLALNLSACVPPPDKAATPAASPPNTTTAASATLEGFVSKIDGNYTRGDGLPIPLSLGCHVISTTANLPGTGHTPVNPMRVPKVHFVIVAEAGHQYVIERVIHSYQERWRRMIVNMKDIDPQGHVVSNASGFESNQPPDGCPVAPH